MCDISPTLTFRKLNNAISMYNLMPYQYKREPLTLDEANRLASACETYQERLLVWTLLATGLPVSELAGLTRDQIDWQNHRLMIYGTGGP
jgi:integrase/recombinase XerD